MNYVVKIAEPQCRVSESVAIGDLEILYKEKSNRNKKGLIGEPKQVTCKEKLRLDFRFPLPSKLRDIGSSKRMTVADFKGVKIRVGFSR